MRRGPYPGGERMELHLVPAGAVKGQDKRRPGRTRAACGVVHHGSDPDRFE